MARTETGLIWVLLATISVMSAFALIKTAETQKHQDDALHTIICTIQDKELHPSHPPDPTAQQASEIRTFWKDELEAARLKPCSAPPPPSVTTTFPRARGKARP